MGTRIGQIADDYITQQRVDAMNAELGTTLTVEQAKGVFTMIMSDGEVIGTMGAARGYQQQFYGLLDTISLMSQKAQQQNAPKREFDALLAAHDALLTEIGTAYVEGEAEATEDDDNTTVSIDLGL